MRPIPRHVDENPKRDELAAALRELVGLDREREEIERQIDSALSRAENIGVAPQQLEVNRKNVLCRFDHTRGYIDSQIAKAMAEISLDTELGVAAVTPPEGIAKHKRLAVADPSISDLNAEERAFLQVLVTGETNMSAGRFGLRATDLERLLVESGHSVSKSNDTRKATIAMLKDLESRGYAFRTGPSLHRVRRNFVAEFQKANDVSLEVGEALPYLP